MEKISWDKAINDAETIIKGIVKKYYDYYASTLHTHDSYLQQMIQQGRDVSKYDTLKIVNEYQAKVKHLSKYVDKEQEFVGFLKGINYPQSSFFQLVKSIQINGVKYESKNSQRLLFNLAEKWTGVDRVGEREMTSYTSFSDGGNTTIGGTMGSSMALGGVIEKNYLKEVLSNEKEYKKLWQLQKDIRLLDKKFGLGATSGLQLHIHANKKELEFEVNNNSQYWDREFGEMVQNNYTQYLKQFKKQNLTYRGYKEELMDDLNKIVGEVGKISGYTLYGTICEGTTDESDIHLFLINSDDYNYSLEQAKKYAGTRLMRKGGKVINKMATEIQAVAIDKAWVKTELDGQKKWYADKQKELKIFAQKELGLMPTNESYLKVKGRLEKQNDACVKIIKSGILQNGKYSYQSSFRIKKYDNGFDIDSFFALDKAIVWDNEKYQDEWVEYKKKYEYGADRDRFAINKLSEITEKAVGFGIGRSDGYSYNGRYLGTRFENGGNINVFNYTIGGL